MTRLGQVFRAIAAINATLLAVLLVMTLQQRSVQIELGAYTRLARPDGRSVADELTSQIDEETKAGRELPVDLLRASALLGTAPVTVHTAPR